MITFKKIRWKNFLSTGNQFTQVDFLEYQTNLIVGTNGAGKSTILDALTFALFNKPFRKINKSQLVNTTNEKETLVEVILSTNDVAVKKVAIMTYLNISQDNASSTEYLKSILPTFILSILFEPS